ncbi:ATP-binding protein [Facilibium subflavum]|uniref:ATP-binding protein n=1 Tax=Facilibium subflavum TaxID=2219058 RepID=UPI000E646092|nr:ATP-binding protein [Facilibium subflavum]
MKNWKKHKSSLKNKLARSHLLVAFIGIVSLGVSLTIMFWLKDHMNRLFLVDMPIIQTAEKLQTQLQNSFSSLHEWESTSQRQFIDNRKRIWENEISPLLSKLESLVKVQNNPDLLPLIANLKQKLSDIDGWQQQIENMGYRTNTQIADNNTTEKKSSLSHAHTWIIESAPLLNQTNLLLNKLINTTLITQKQKITTIIFLIDSSIYGLVFLIIGLVIFSIWLAIFNANKLLKPVQLLKNATTKLSSGDLKDNIPIATNDELGELTRAFNTMFEQRRFLEKRLVQVIETAVDPIITINAKGIIQSCNSATTTLLGHKESALIGENIAMLMPEPYRSQHDQYLKNYLSTHVKKIIGLSREVEALTKSGERIPIVLSVSEINVDGVRYFTGIIHDIRKEKAQANEMKKLNQQLKHENMVKTINAELEDMLRGVDDLQLFTKKSLAFFAKHFKTLIGLFYQITNDHKVKLINTYGIDAEQKAHIKQPILVDDIAQQREVTIIETLPSNYFYISSGSGQALPEQVLFIPLIYQGTISGVLELGCLHKLSGEQLQHLELLSNNLVIGLNMVIAKQELQTLLVKTKQQHQQLLKQEESLRQSNEELESQAKQLKKSEEKLRNSNEDLQLKMQLIEQQKEEIIQKSKEIERTSRYKSEFLANMSHELRTPLNSLLILAQSFMENKQGNLTKTQQQEARIIYEAGNDLLALINDILDISKVEAGKLAVEITQVSLKEVIKSIDQHFTPQAKNKNLTFTIDYDETMHNVVFESDKTRLMQILKNLLSNAFKFTEKGSVKLIITTTTKQIHFQVTDTGIGIEKSKQKLVFDEFHQEDGSISRKFGGTGLGLSISQKLAHLLKGKITLKSKKGIGSTFTLSLPKKSHQAQVKKKTEDRKNTHGLKRSQKQLKAISTTALPPKLDLTDKVILLVDDDLRNTFALSRSLESQGMKVIIADNGELALEKLQQSEKIDLVIMDIMMPVMDGFTAIKKIREIAKYHDLPIIVLSAKTTEQDKQKSFAAGADDYMSKPVDINDLLALISHWTHRSEKA